MTQKANVSLSYKKAGVDIDAGNRLVERIKPIAEKTKRSELLSGLGGFSAACRIPSEYRQPILISSTDGVGSKVKLAMQLNQHDSIGIDLVAMCVNDIIVCGAEPLYFLDYYATGHLDVDMAERVISGIGRGCELANCSLAGGETAEMPTLYEGCNYDLAGFCVGVVEKDEIINGANVSHGDVIVALASSGMHANGYALVHKLLEQDEAVLHQSLHDGSDFLADLLLQPTRIYVSSILQLTRNFPVYAMSHITGGGLLENIPRSLPKGVQAVIDTKSWSWEALFQWVQKTGGVTDREMYRTFNCGVGMTVIIPKECAHDAIAFLEEIGEKAWLLGEVRAMKNSDKPIVLTGL